MARRFQLQFHKQVRCHSNTFTAYGQTRTPSSFNLQLESVMPRVAAMERPSSQPLPSPRTDPPSKSPNFLSAETSNPYPPATTTGDPNPQLPDLGVSEESSASVSLQAVGSGRGPASPQCDIDVPASNENALILSNRSYGPTATLTIPSLKTRRAETRWRFPSGGSLAMAALFRINASRQINVQPGCHAGANTWLAVQDPRRRQSGHLARP